MLFDGFFRQVAITALSERAAQWMNHGKELGERRRMIRVPELHVAELPAS